MKVCIDYAGGDYSLRQCGYNNGLSAESFRVPDGWTWNVSEIEDHVVQAYAALMAQYVTMQTLLCKYTDDANHKP